MTYDDLSQDTREETRSEDNRPRLGRMALIAVATGIITLSALYYTHQISYQKGVEDGRKLERAETIKYQTPGQNGH